MLTKHFLLPSYTQEDLVSDFSRKPPTNVSKVNPSNSKTEFLNSIDISSKIDKEVFENLCNLNQTSQQSFVMNITCKCKCVQRASYMSGHCAHLNISIKIAFFEFHGINRYKKMRYISV